MTRLTPRWLATSVRNKLLAMALLPLLVVFPLLVLAIALATLNNFTWNRLWTWSDRVKTLEAGEVQPVSLRLLGMEFGQYVTASAFGSGMQYVLTLLLSGSMDYRLANIIAILAASVSNFLANDRWTFKRHRD